MFFPVDVLLQQGYSKGHPLLTGVLTGMMQARKTHIPQILGHNPVVGMRLGGIIWKPRLVFPVFFLPGPTPFGGLITTTSCLAIHY